jgi:hypothetical protein
MSIISNYNQTITELPSYQVTGMVFHYFKDNIWSGVVNEAIIPILKFAGQNKIQGKIIFIENKSL